MGCSKSQKERFEHFTRLITVLIVLGMILLLLGSIQSAWGGDALNPQVETAFLEEKWEQVVTLLDTDQAPSPVRRFLKAHAYLALNQNNDSLCLLFGATPEDLHVWETWTRALVTQRPHGAMAHYLRGDAFARLQQWEMAHKSFTQALTLRPNHSLVLNARGVAYAAQGQRDLALADLRQATKADLRQPTSVIPALADAYANLGAWYIQHNIAAEEALKAFNRALELSPNSALALNGRGGVKTVQKQWRDALQDFAEARASIKECLSSIADVLAVNVTTLSYAVSEAASQVLANTTKRRPGMTVQARAKALDFDHLSQEKVADLKGTLQSAIAFNQRVKEVAPDQMKVEVKTSISAKEGPKVELSAGGEYKMRERTEVNLKYQRDSLAILDKKYPDVKQQEKPFLAGLFDGNKFDKYTHEKIGGVSSDMSGARVDRGNWHVTTLYGLLYVTKAQGK